MNWYSNPKREMWAGLLTSMCPVPLTSGRISSKQVIQEWVQNPPAKLFTTTVPALLDCWEKKGKKSNLFWLITNSNHFSRKWYANSSSQLNKVWEGSQALIWPLAALISCWPQCSGLEESEKQQAGVFRNPCQWRQLPFGLTPPEVSLTQRSVYSLDKWMCSHSPQLLHWLWHVVVWTQCSASCKKCLSDKVSPSC